MASPITMHKLTVIKRDGSEVPVKVQEIQDRITSLCHDLTDLDPAAITIHVIGGLKDRMKTSELDDFAAQLCSANTSKNPQYGQLATRLVVSNCHKVTSASFTEVMKSLYWHYDQAGQHYPLITPDIYEMLIAEENGVTYGSILDSYVNHDRDIHFNYFGLITLMKAYLLKKHYILVERPQHLYMRVALQIHGTDLNRVIETYNYMSEHKMIHATPALQNACTPCGNMISCFLLGTNDSMAELYDTVKDCALISKASGGIGLHVSNVRIRGSPIYSTGGTSKGIAPYLKVLNEIGRASCRERV